jgi:histone acetyltransferase
MCEIAFCAISANEQVKGYGTRLMNHLKEYVKEEEDMTHLITFADNNAVGYFSKQGFTKDIVMEREKWVGYIKEYDGGTIMECALEAQISYVDFPKNIRAQRECVEAKVREMTTAHVVYPGLTRFKDGGEFGKHRITDPLSTIKGLKEAKWKAPDPPRYRLVHPGCGDGYPTIENLHKFMRSIVAIVKTHPDSWPFMSAVNKEEVPDYYEVVKDPTDIESVSERVESENYYVTLEMFAADFKRMFENCRLYNAVDTIYYKCANRLELFFDAKIAAGITFKVREAGSYLNR